MTIDTSQFIQAFFEESFEGLETMEAGLMDLENGAEDGELVNNIFRAAHSIKGGAGTFGFAEVSSFTHVMETLLDEVREGARHPSRELVDLQLEAVDFLRDWFTAMQTDNEADEARKQDLQKRMEAMLAAGGGEAPAQTDSGASEGATGGAGWRIVFKPEPHLFRTGNDPVRILRELEELGTLKVQSDLDELPGLDELDPESSYLAWEMELEGDVARDDIDEVFAWVEDDCELTVEPLTTADEAAPSESSEPAGGGSGDAGQGGKGGSAGGGKKPKKDASSIRVGIDKVDSVINLVGELVITQSMLSTLGEDFTMDRLAQLQDGLAQLERNTRELQEEVMRMRMLPIGSVFSRVPRLVRDLGSKLGKEVDLQIAGEATELDKTVIEKLGDPLVHLIRNAMDHGLEDPDTREAAGKPRTGALKLDAYHQGGNIVVEIGDDGKGLDPEKILAKAVEKGVVDADASLSEQEMQELIFAPGFSTAAEISDVSGRGVGMDVVRKNIQALGGNIGVRSAVGEGTTFLISLPLTLAILDGQSVRVGDDSFILPLISIMESTQPREEELNYVAGKGSTFQWRDQYLPIIPLARMFGIENGVTDPTEGLLVVVEGDGRRVALLVDDLLGQQQVVIKSLEDNYGHIEGISGATILGDGSVALILDIPGLVRMTKQEGSND